MWARPGHPVLYCPWADGPGWYRKAGCKDHKEQANRQHSSMPSSPVPTSPSCPESCPGFTQKCSCKLQEEIGLFFLQLPLVMVCTSAVEMLTRHPSLSSAYVRCSFYLKMVTRGLIALTQNWPVVYGSDLGFWFCRHSLLHSLGSHGRVWDGTLHLSLSDFFLLVLVHKYGSFPFSHSVTLGSRWHDA